jgi:uncharacterized protein (TIGR01244 family)
MLGIRIKWRSIMKMKLTLSILGALAISASLFAAQNKVTKDTVPGITNYAHIETTVACAGAITPSSVAEIKKMGYASIINLREASEQGADIDAEKAAADKAGIRFVHVPFNGNKPSTEAVDQFLKAIKTAGTEPAFIHCAGGNRAASMWFVKRVLVDKWDTDRAMAEATDLGFASPALKTFAMDYVKAHQK